MTCSRYQLFLFGSALTTSSPRDLDILIVYDGGPEDAVRFRQKLSSKLGGFTNRPIHAILLSTKEEIELDFIQKERCRRLAREDVRRLRRAGQ